MSKLNNKQSDISIEERVIQQFKKLMLKEFIIQNDFLRVKKYEMPYIRKSSIVKFSSFVTNEGFTIILYTIDASYEIGFDLVMKDIPITKEQIKLFSGQVMAMILHG